MAPKIKWNLKAFKELRTSPDVDVALQNIVDSILNEVNTGVPAGEDDLYKGNVSKGKTRSVGRVWTAGTHAERSNAKHNTLVRAIANAGDGS